MQQEIMKLSPSFVSEGLSYSDAVSKAIKLVKTLYYIHHKKKS
jgi:hypothetical protein